MDNKPKDAPKTKDVLKQLQSELRQLQTTVNALQKPDAAASAGGESSAHPDKTDKADWVVQYSVRYPLAAGKALAYSYSEPQLSSVADDAAAALGYALSSPQKVALLRALLTRETESAAALGETTQLSTGSLYHHLHDLMHAGLIGQSARNRYILTEQGRRVLLLVLALAVQP